MQFPAHFQHQVLALLLLGLLSPSSLARAFREDTPLEPAEALTLPPLQALALWEVLSPQAFPH